MQIAILISGSIAAILFFLSGISYFFNWFNFQILALGFLVFSVLMFILIIIRNLKQEWTIGGYKPKE